MEFPSHFRQIGKGFCGSVWAADRAGPASAMKREDGGPERNVANDSAMHLRIEKSLRKVQSEQGLARNLNIPEHRELVQATDLEWWKSREHSFPPGHQHCQTLITERILPLDKDAREKIVDLFCAESSKAVVKANRKDEDCLIRPYLGRREDKSKPSKFFTLRNKPLRIDQMESIGLPVRGYAREMADTLAVMYWHSQTNANDIEFVLAPARPNETTFASEVLGEHRLWVLDFDCVRSMSLDATGVEQAASAFLRNDPFYPRPCEEDAEDYGLWRFFSSRFLESSKLILGDSELPQLFISRLEELGKERRAKAAKLKAEGGEFCS